MVSESEIESEFWAVAADWMGSLVLTALLTWGSGSHPTGCRPGIYTVNLVLSLLTAESKWYATSKSQNTLTVPQTIFDLADSAVL